MRYLPKVQQIYSVINKQEEQGLERTPSSKDNVPNQPRWLPENLQEMELIPWSWPPEKGVEAWVVLHQQMQAQPQGSHCICKTELKEMLPQSRALITDTFAVLCQFSPNHCTTGLPDSHRKSAKYQQDIFSSKLIKRWLDSHSNTGSLTL